MNEVKWFSIITFSIVLSLFLVSIGKCSVVMKAVVVNPSQEEAQEATLKAYLPKEVTPKDIIDLGDLKVGYDVEKSLYYVHKKVELGPGEVAKREIEIKDIWVISEKKLDSIIQKADNILKKLENTSYYDRASSLNEEIKGKIETVQVKQKEAMDALPNKHIAVYRENMKRLKTVKNDLLSELEELARKAKPSSGISVKRIFVEQSWWIILSIIIFLALLSFIFFIVWYRQAEVVKKERESEEFEFEREESSSEGETSSETGDENISESEGAEEKEGE